jgi:hypothetical protein
VSRCGTWRIVVFPGRCSGIVEGEWTNDLEAFAVIDESRFRGPRRRWLKRLSIDLEGNSVAGALPIREKELNRDPHDEPNDDHKDGYGHIRV